jgi:hypothetical protein
MEACMSDAPDGIHLTRLEVLNFQKVRVAVFDDLKPGLNSVTSGGKNRQGKTSTLTAIRALFEGAGAVPPEARNSDAPEGAETVVRGYLSNGFTIRRKVTAKGTYLAAANEEGLQAKQATIDGWRSGVGMDVMGLYALRDREILDAVVKLSSEPDLLDRLAEIDQKRKDLYDERTPHISDERRLRGIPKPEGEKPEVPDTKADLALLDALDQRQNAYLDLKRDVSSARESVFSLNRHAKEAEGRVERLRRELEEAESALVAAEGRLDVAVQDQQKAEKALADAEDPTPEIHATRLRISEAEAARTALYPWAKWEEAQAQLEHSIEEKARLTAAMDALTAEREALLASASFPVEGLGIDSEGNLLLNGHPLSQASGRERVVFATRVAEAANPKLRIVLHDEGSDIDADGLAELHHFCLDRKLQLFLCRLGLEGPGELEIVDGMGGDMALLTPENRKEAGPDLFGEEG